MALLNASGGFSFPCADNVTTTTATAARTTTNLGMRLSFTELESAVHELRQPIDTRFPFGMRHDDRRDRRS
jgi:hypothetical protein